MKESEYGSVLIVDDEQGFLELATFFLTREGVEVHCAADGEEALSKIRKRTFTMMITYLNMPCMNGLELTRKAREIAPAMPIIMSTGDKSPKICRLAKEAGIVEVFAKPFNFGEIIAIIRERVAKEKNQADPYSR